jgi:dienelactone hydrolase
MWLRKHGDSATTPIIDKVLKEVRANMGASKIGTVGYCFGGRYSILYAGQESGREEVDAFAVAHPSK